MDCLRAEGAASDSEYMGDRARGLLVDPPILGFKEVSAVMKESWEAGEADERL